MTIQLSKLLSTGEFGQFLTNRHTVVTVCRHNGYRSELGHGSTIIWRESGTVDHLKGNDHHMYDVSALRLLRRVPNLRRAAIGSTFWTLGGYRARIESKLRPDTDNPLWSCAVYRPDGSWHSTMNYNRYGLPSSYSDSVTSFDMVWSVNDIDKELQLHVHTIDIHSNPAHKIDAAEAELRIAAALSDGAIYQAASDARHGTAATLGHLASNGGLRGHSVGDIFPYIHMYKGPNFENWVRCPDGTEEGPFANRDAMIRFIETHQLMKEHDALPTFTMPPLVVKGEEPSELLMTPKRAERTLELLNYIDGGHIQLPVGVLDDDNNFHTLDEYLEIIEKSNKLQEESAHE